MNYRRIVPYLALGAVAAAFVVACGPKGESSASGGSSATGTSNGTAKLSGEVTVDGSSTVLPISEGVAEEFRKVQPDVNVTVGKSGTGGGFKKFAAGEIDIAGASRPIEPEEIEAATKGGIEFVELPVAYDGLSVVVNPKNTFVDKLTVAELKKIWEPNSKVKTWADVRAGWPAKPIKLYGPGTDSGTFDYFTEAIMGKKGASRPDYQQSEDDNVLVQGVAGDEFALGYFGFSYLMENEGKIKGVPIDNNNGTAVPPSAETIANGTYQPLSRPLLIYVSKKSLEEKPAVLEYVKYFLGDGLSIVEEVNYVKLPDEAYALGNQRVTDKKTGTTFHGAEVGVSVVDLMKKEPQK